MQNLITFHIWMPDKNQPQQNYGIVVESPRKGDQAVTQFSIVGSNSKSRNLPKRPADFSFSFEEKEVNNRFLKMKDQLSNYETEIRTDFLKESITEDWEKEKNWFKQIDKYNEQRNTPKKEISIEDQWAILSGKLVSNLIGDVANDLIGYSWSERSRKYGSYFGGSNCMPSPETPEQLVKFIQLIYETNRNGYSNIKSDPSKYRINALNKLEKAWYPQMGNISSFFFGLVDTAISTVTTIATLGIIRLFWQPTPISNYYRKRYWKNCEFIKNNDDMVVAPKKDDLNNNKKQLFIVSGRKNIQKKCKTDTTTKLFDSIIDNKKNDETSIQKTWEDGDKFNPCWKGKENESNENINQVIGNFIGNNDIMVFKGINKELRNNIQKYQGTEIKDQQEIPAYHN